MAKMKSSKAPKSKLKAKSARTPRTAKAKKPNRTAVEKNPELTELTLALNHPGLTNFLRAGLGGLAATLRAQAKILNPKAKWPSPFSVADGEATVTSQAIHLRFGTKGPLKFFEALLKNTFRIEKPGVVYIPGTIEPGTDDVVALQIAQQRAYKRTFLQHGSTTKFTSSEKTHQYEIDDKSYRLSLKPYKSFAHQDALELIAKALTGKTTRMAGWVNPGASQRHVSFPETICDYQLVEAIAGIFAMVGCISMLGAGSTGLLVIPRPTDLVTFARTRPRLTPRTVKEFTVAGIGDAAMAVLVAVKFVGNNRYESGVGELNVSIFRTLAWAKQQKSRAQTLRICSPSDDVLDQYEHLESVLPSRLVVKSEEADVDEDGDDFFVATSALRGFVAENMANGRRWYTHFSTATVGGKKPRFIHYYRERDGGHGALYPEEKKGLIAMEQHLENAELALVKSVHQALRQRFAQIAEESKDVKATMLNRFDGERDKWRLAFAGSKTADQIRTALADLWSRAGSNKELQSSWAIVLPLLRADRWQSARDLALIALASYQSVKNETSTIETDKE